jgi:hypothetical protein
MPAPGPADRPFRAACNVDRRMGLAREFAKQRTELDPTRVQTLSLHAAQTDLTVRDPFFDPRLAACPAHPQIGTLSEPEVDGGSPADNHRPREESPGSTG